MSYEWVNVIGGGLAGLSVAVALADSGLRIRLHEQCPFLGGRATSYVLPDGSFVDNCQHVTLGCRALSSLSRPPLLPPFPRPPLHHRILPPPPSLPHGPLLLPLLRPLPLRQILHRPRHALHRSLRRPPPALLRCHHAHLASPHATNSHCHRPLLARRSRLR